MHSVVTSLPSNEIQCEVSCERVENLDQFPVSKIHCMAQTSPLKYRFNQVMRRLRFPAKLQFRALKDHIKDVNPHIVHSHFATTGVLDFEIVRQTGAKHVVTTYGSDISRLPQAKPRMIPHYIRMFRDVDAVLCEGPYMAKTVVSLGCSPEKVIVQRLGVDLSRFEFRPRQWSIGDPLKLLIAASFVEKKGIPYALEAIARISRSHEVLITVIGDSVSFAGSQLEKAKILQVVDQHEIGHLVNWLGFQKHEKMLEAAYDNHIFVSTSVQSLDGDNEGGAPVAIIEMAATGMPVLSSMHCDIPSVILDGKTGWLAKERDVDSIERCLQTAIAHRKNWNQMCRKGREHLEESFDLSVQGIKLAEIYRRILSD
jgi:colanic acid/amylovoran biosynthesis glycosyltransferase